MVLVSILFFSCKNGIISEIEKPSIVYYTHYIVKDSFYWPEATYIEKTNMVTYLDTIADTTRYISAPTCSKIVFERENNISMRYIGGYRDTSITCDLTAEVDTLFTNEYMDSINAIIYIPKDTVTVTRITKFSYAIFEITRGSEVFLDTALYNLDYTSKCLNIYCCNPQNIYNTQDILNNYNSLYNTSLTTPFAYLKFIPYYPENYCISVPSKNRKIYMIDIFPLKWGQIDSTHLIFFHLTL